jgi:hypothetical protein
VILRRPSSLDPRAIGGLALWFDAFDAPSPGSWADKSGNGRNASQAAFNNQPEYAASAINGRPGLYFDGINDSLSIPVVPLASCHVFAVVSPVSSTGKVVHVAASSTLAFSLTSTNTPGLLAASGTLATVTSTPGMDTRMGAGWDSGAIKNFYKGYVGEVLVYGSVLAAAQVASVSNYLNRKWGL